MLSCCAERVSPMGAWESRSLGVESGDEARRVRSRLAAGVAETALDLAPGLGAGAAASRAGDVPRERLFIRRARTPMLFLGQHAGKEAGLRVSPACW
jgi:hypothetical protein